MSRGNTTPIRAMFGEGAITAKTLRAMKAELAALNLDDAERIHDNEPKAAERGLEDEAVRYKRAVRKWKALVALIALIVRALIEIRHDESE
jgi:hypothetical protein